ncbi:hypothetical protein HBI56_069180 [Parastagonospora nodorum]|nr:hypothetical protein HBH51_086380 [Parastagonospora nodorum]KAH3978083.1 hypothetical protein HBH52_106430 [Parastagonospora nodorum]KAH4001326.1 hypothetical protein HBI10_088110 [Parastagonospora nodorum]KAH4027310.1 hypothetical protein HBI13_057130 [Parastagonospora nodorum]KAH4035626.1 hypothetical protein HBI09_089350 [Parastagonospora nodorum]
MDSTLLTLAATSVPYQRLPDQPTPMATSTRNERGQTLVSRCKDKMQALRARARRALEAKSLRLQQRVQKLRRQMRFHEESRRAKYAAKSTQRKEEKKARKEGNKVRMERFYCERRRPDGAGIYL